MSSQYGGKDETCPVSTGGRTRRVQLVQGEGGGGAGGGGGLLDRVPLAEHAQERPDRRRWAP